ncbi:hypothetical protein [Salinifilum ghardaiensis]
MSNDFEAIAAGACWSAQPSVCKRRVPETRSPRRARLLVEHDAASST